MGDPAHPSPGVQAYSRPPGPRDTRAAPQPTWRAAHRSTCARRRGPASPRLRSSGLSPLAGTGAASPRSAAPISPLIDPLGALDTAFPGTRPGSSQPQGRGQTPRDLPAVARDFPQHGALERARDCAQALLPSAAGARASRRKQASSSTSARRASHLCEFHHDGGLRRRRVWRASSSEEPGATHAMSSAAAGTGHSGARTTACQLQLASEAKD